MTEAEIYQKYSALVASEFPNISSLRQNENIWENGAIDSLGLITFIGRLEDVFEYSFPQVDLTDDTFATSASILAYLRIRLATDG